MANNPLTAQGTLNRLRASVTIPDHPDLNITASYLGDEGIGLTLDGEQTTYIPTLTGAVVSPEPYQPITLTAHLLKSQPLSDAFKSRSETDTTLGDVTVRPDATTLSPYQLVNCSIRAVAELRLNGKDAGYRITIGGYYQINNNLWSA